MKSKIIALMLCCFLAGCIRAGNYDLAPVRKKIFNSINGYSIDYVDQEEEFLGRESRREHDYVMNKAVTVRKGEALLSDKTFDQETYRKWVYKPNKKGALQSLSYPVRLDNKQEYNVLGWIKIDGTPYAVLDSGLDDFVFMFDEQGNFYNHPGHVEDGIVILLDEEIFVYPSDLKMMTVAKMRDQVSNVKNGYEIKYGGTKLDRIWFDYMDYDADYNSGGVFEKLNFPNKPGLITINGKGLRVLKADDDAITYMILKD